MKRIMRHMLPVLLVILLIAAIGMPSVLAEDTNSGTCGDNLTWTFDGSGTLTISGTGPMYDYGFQPEGVDEWHPSPPAPWNELDVKRIIIENGVTYLGGGIADNRYKALIKEITIPASVTSINEYAIIDFGIESILIRCTKNSAAYAYAMRHWSPCYLFDSNVTCGRCGEDLTWELDTNGVLTIAGSGAMLDYSLVDSSGPPLGYVTAYGPWGRGPFKSITVENGVTYLGQGAFYIVGYPMCEITIPASVTSLHENFICWDLSDNFLNAFIHCTKNSAAQEYAVEHSICYDFTDSSELPVMANGKCGNNLTYTITSDGTFTLNGTGRMDDCYGGLIFEWPCRQVELNPGVTYIGAEAFWKYVGIGNNYIKSVTIPEGVTEIGFKAFSTCPLQSIQLPGTLSRIDAHAFNTASLHSITLPNSLTHIGTFAFGSNVFDKIVVPANVKTIGHDVLHASDIVILSRDCVFDFDDFDDGLYNPADGTTTGNSISADTVHCYPGSTAEAYCKQYGINYVLLSAEDPASGTFVDVVTGKDFPAGTTLYIAPNTELDTDALFPDAEMAAAYNIELHQGDQVIQPDGTVRVTLPVPEGMDGARCSIYRMEEDGSFTDMNAVYSNGVLTFETEHFSVYVIVQASTQPDPTDPQPTDPTEPQPTEPAPTEPTEPAPTDPTGPVPTEPTDPVPTDPTVPSEQPTAPFETVEPTSPTKPIDPENPTTGDSGLLAPSVLLIVMSLICLAAVVLLAKRTHLFK